jgi:hypothetical protein
MSNDEVTSTTIATQRPPDEALPFLYGGDPSYYGILPEVEAMYRARRLTPEQIAALPLPMQQVAARTPLQAQGTRLAQLGVGSYQPMLEAAAGTVGSGVTGIGSALRTLEAGFDPLAQAQRMVETSTAGGMRGVTDAATMGQTASQRTAENILGQVGMGQRALVGSAGDIQDIGALSQRAGMGAGADVMNLGRKTEQVGLSALRELPAYGRRLEQQGQIAARQTLQAGSAADELGQYGLTTAQAGIQGLRGTGAEFDPSRIAEYMSPYEQQAVDVALQDIARQGERQRAALGAQAVGAGAFGGSRQGIESAELSRSILEQQARTAAGMRQAGYESAAGRAMQAYEAAKARQQAAATATGQLGQAGAATGLRAAQTGIGAAGQAGQMAMQGTQAGAGIAGQATQLGLAGLGQAAQQRASSGQLNLAGLQQGLAAAGQAGSMGAQASQMGIGAAQAAGQAQMQGAQMGLQGAQAAGQMGLAGAGQMGALAGQYGALGQGIGGLAGQLGSLGMQQAQLGEAQQGLALNDVNTLMSIGAQEQQQRQAELNAQFANQQAQYNQPFQNLGFYSDVYQGMPIGQSQYGETREPAPSTLSQLGGIATGLYGMYRGMQ